MATPMPDRRPYDDDELVAMSHSYSTTHEGTYIAHLAYEEINRQVGEEGRAWAKCMNCGNPYPLDRPGATAENICSSNCWDSYADYLNAEIRNWKTGAESWYDSEY